MSRAYALALLAGCGGVPAASDLLAPARGFDLVLEGAQSVSQGDLARAIAFDLDEFEARGFTRPAADDAAFGLGAHYRRLGFRLAEVDWSLAADGERPRLTLSVVEGPRTTIDEGALSAEGVSEFTREEVLGFFNGPRLGALGRGALIYLEARVRAVPGRMVDEYVNRGYLDARVDPVAARFSEDGTVAYLALTALEGRRYHVGRVRLAPGQPRVGDGAAYEALFAGMRLEQGQPRTFDPRLPFELRGQLQEYLGRVGHPEARVQVESAVQDEAAEEPRVDLTVHIDPGPEVTVSGVRFAGNEITNLGFLQSRMQLEPGQRFDGRLVRDSLRRLYRTGLFKSVELELAPLADQPDLEGEPVKRELVVTVEEGPTREYWAEPGYGSYELLRLRIGAREKNLLGTGRQLRAEATAAVRALRGEVGLTDPWLFGSDLIGDLSVDFDERQNPSFTGRSTSLGASVTHEWAGPRVATTIGYRFRRSEVEDVDVIDSAVLAAVADLDLSSLILSQRFDYRDHVLVPRDGDLVEASLEWGDRALGSQLDFLRATVNLTHYEKLDDDLVLAAALRTGVIAPHGQDAGIPLQERFFNGGGNTVRSFLEDELGPTDIEGNPVGGEAWSVLNVELRKRIMESKWEVAAFVDAGNVVPDASDWLSFDDLRAGVGVGVRYWLPIGPVRLDVAANPDPRPGEDELAVHLALGISF